MNLLQGSDDDHTRTIVHIDIDCFYAQVEMVKDPSLQNVPLGIQQKNIVVTCNYVARKYGVKKCMRISDARSLCPSLVLVNGEDLYDYRKISYQVSNYLRENFSPLVERLGLDENYIDVTDLVQRKSMEMKDLKAAGNLYGDLYENCPCGCEERLKIASHVAQEMRDGIRKEFQLTTCAGIGHNKLVAKLVGTTHKPNQQSLVFPVNCLELLSNLKVVSDIPGIGYATGRMLSELNINTVLELRDYDCSMLQTAMGSEKARLLKELSYGRDSSVVKPFEHPQSIGLEDACKPIGSLTNVEEKFGDLLSRLMVLVKEDGRIPGIIRITVRKYDGSGKYNNRESRQCAVSPNLFNITPQTDTAAVTEKEKQLLLTIMNLFRRIINVKASYQVNLLGVSFTKFQEQCSGKKSIVSYFQNATSSPGLDRRAKSIVEEPLCKKSRFDLDCGDVVEATSSSRTSTDVEDDVRISTNVDGSSECPPNVDKEVFLQLPMSIQQEIWSDWRKNNKPTCKSTKLGKSNTLLNYFSKQ